MSAVTLLLLPFRQGLSLSLELGWQPVSPRDLPVSALLGARPRPVRTWLLTQGLGIQTLIRRLE